MGNDTELTELARLFKLETQINKLVMEGARTPAEVANVLQKILEQSVQKFTLLADLGTITVPKGYVHTTALATFKKQNNKMFSFFSDHITDANFPNPTRILKPGDTLRVCAYGHTVKGTETTSHERMAFLKSQNAVLVGAQGASLVFEQKRQKLPKGKWYASFDEPDRLWVGANGDHGVPGVGADGDGDFRFLLGAFELPWPDSGAFLCFSDVPLET